jgi:hypothetical protein
MLFETLAYVVGYQLYRRLKQSFGDPISQDKSMVDRRDGGCRCRAGK